VKRRPRTAAWALPEPRRPPQERVSTTKTRRPATGSDGFTLIELLIVIIIIGILAAIAIPMFLSQRNKAKDASVKEGIHSIQVGIQSYAVDNSDAYPAAGQVSNTTLAGYVDNWPKNPFSATSGTYMSEGAGQGQYNYTTPASNTFRLVGHMTSTNVTVP
jgi:type II secretion system protein G